MNRFENTDSLSFMATLQKGEVDLVLTDPPYIISHETGFKSVKEGVQRFAVETEFGDWDRPENFSMSDLEASVKEYYRVLRDGGTAIIFCDLWKVSYIKEMMERHKFKQIRFIDWVKTNPVPLNSKRNYLTNSREVAILGVKKSKPTFNSEYDSGLYRYPICHDRGRFHSTQKPLAFMEELVKKTLRHRLGGVGYFCRCGNNSLGSEKSR